MPWKLSARVTPPSESAALILLSSLSRRNLPLSSRILGIVPISADTSSFVHLLLFPHFNFDFIASPRSLDLLSIATCLINTEALQKDLLMLGYFITL